MSCGVVWWVGWSSVLVAMGVWRVSYTFAFWTHMVSPLSFDLYYCCMSFAVPLYYMVGGWIASWASLLYYTLLYCCGWVHRLFFCVLLSRVHGFVAYFFHFISFFHRCTGHALAWFSVPLVFYLKLENVGCEYDRWVVETQLCKLRDTSDTAHWACLCYVPIETWCL